MRLTHVSIAAALALVLVAGLWFLFRAPEAVSYTPGKGASIPADWIEFQNPGHRFAFSHPPEISVKEYDEGNNSVTLVFSEKGSAHSFQIFITPYTEDHITKERFAMDMPSGVFENPIDVMIGGTTRGTVFDGEHALLGKTREVWFIHGGFLFEVTTYRELDAWLSAIMATWKFQ